MKIASMRAQVIGMLLAILFSQWACSFGGSTPDDSPQVPPSVEQATQAPVPTKGERGTPDEAKAMLQLVVEHYNQVGRDQAYTDFNAGQLPFKDRDLYVVCITQNHTESVNGGYPQFVGTSADAVKDVNGKPLGQAILDSVSATGQGETNYQWVNPVSGATEPKILFAQKLGDDVCGVGAYNP